MMKITIILTIITCSRNKLAEYLVAKNLNISLIVLSEFQWVTLMVEILFIKRNQIFRVLSQDRSLAYSIEICNFWPFCCEYNIQL